MLCTIKPVASALCASSYRKTIQKEHVNRRLEKEPLDYSVLKRGEKKLLQEQQNLRIPFLLWRSLPWLDYLKFIMIKAFPVAGVFIALLSCVGSVVSNSMGNFALQSCCSERTVVQISTYFLETHRDFVHLRFLCSIKFG